LDTSNIGRLQRSSGCCREAELGYLFLPEA
jgi:hypothetical protein